MIELRSIHGGELVSFETRQFPLLRVVCLNYATGTSSTQGFVDWPRALNDEDWNLSDMHRSQ